MELDEHISLWEWKPQMMENIEKVISKLNLGYWICYL
jgi:hypothetical protein